jgi:fucokinase
MLTGCAQKTDSRPPSGAVRGDKAGLEPGAASKAKPGAGAPAPFDHLVITAANEKQTEGYRLQLELRRRTGQIPAATRTHVIADPDGRRIGSGGATLMAFARLLEALPPGPSIAATFHRQRILILHGGGDSKRLPAYAAQGKLFVPLPCPRIDGQPAMLFDLLLARLLQIRPPAGGHVLVAAGDVLLTFDPAELDFDQAGVVGVAYADQPERAARHGVYLADPAGRVVDFLQKPDAAELRAAGALDAMGCALIDTGLLSFDPAAVATFCRAAGLSLARGRVTRQAGLLADIEAGTAGEVDLYEEVALALARRTTPGVYRRRVLSRPRNAGAAQQARLRSLYRAIHGLDFHARVLSHCDFFHIGSSRELLAGVLGRTRTSATYDFRNLAQAVVPADFSRQRAFAFNSVIETDQVNCGQAALLEAVHAHCPLVLSGRNIVTNLPGEVECPLRLPDGVGFVMLPVDRPGGWSAILYGIDDDFGSPHGLGNCSFLNRPVNEFLGRYGLEPEVLWPEGTRSLYFARLWCQGGANQVVAQTCWMLAPAADPEALAAWRGRKRFSIADLVRRIDYERLLAHQANLQRLWAIHRPFERLAKDPDVHAAGLVEQVRSRREAAAMMADLALGVQRDPDPNLRARALALGMLLRRHADLLPADRAAQPQLDASSRALAGGAGTARGLGEAASAAVAEVVALRVHLPVAPPVAAIERDQVIWATAPARLDFGGGWSDTPPICTDRGGTVVNAAVTLNGQYPLQVIAKLNDRYTINLTSIDLGQRGCYDHVEQLYDYTDPARWDSLAKACLYLAGFTAGKSRGALRPVLRRFGGGIDLTLFSALPKGSGLGTSAILGATVLACLARLSGECLSQDLLIRRTSLLEQLMTTGGGWQDQVGGLFPGVKLICTAPGPEQTPSVFWLAFDREGWRRRLLLYYTGRTRLAKHILQNAVHKYLAREPSVLDTIDRLKVAALQVREAIDTRDLDGFGAGLRLYWELKKRLDPGSTTPPVEQLIARVDARCTGYGLLGAGGGGFLLMVAKDEEAAFGLRAELTARAAGPGARFFDFAIDDRGVQVCVL